MIARILTCWRKDEAKLVEIIIHIVTQNRPLSHFNAQYIPQSVAISKNQCS